MAAKTTKGGRTKICTPIFVARSDGVEYSKNDISAKIRGGEDVLSDALDGDNEHVRAWMIKLGKVIKYNLGVADDSASQLPALWRCGV